MASASKPVRFNDPLHGDLGVELPRWAMQVRERMDSITAKLRIKPARSYISDREISVPRRSSAPMPFFAFYPGPCYVPANVQRERARVT